MGGKEERKSQRELFFAISARKLKPVTNDDDDDDDSDNSDNDDEFLRNSRQRTGEFRAILARCKKRTQGSTAKV